MPQNAGNHSILQGLLDAGALGFKSFMSPAGESHDSPIAKPCGRHWASKESNSDTLAHTKSR